MRRLKEKAGMTLVEVLMAVVLISIAATLVYSGGLASYKMLMRSRMRLEAQGIAFDKLWQLFNLPLNAIMISSQMPPLVEPTPAGGAFPDGGLIRSVVLPETNAPLDRIDYWEIIVQVFAPSNSLLFSVMNDDGTVQAAYSEPLAEYRILRYPGER